MRGASGGLLFGIPLLYTMEIWWTGTHSTPLQTLGVLALTAVPIYLLNQTSGFRRAGEVRVRDAVMDTVEAIALGLVVVTAVLVVLREVTSTTPLAAALAKIVYEALPFCLGISVANHFLQAGRADPDEGNGSDEGAGEQDEGRLSATIADIGATAVGAIFIALNIAPTDEVPMLASAMTPVWILALMAMSLAASYGIVFAAGFANQERRQRQTGVFQRPVTETIACYLVALVCAALMLWLFQRIHGPWSLTLDHVVVLGFPATIGGAAGRLAI